MNQLFRRIIIKKPTQSQRMFTTQSVNYQSDAKDKTSEDLHKRIMELEQEIGEIKKDSATLIAVNMWDTTTNTKKIAKFEQEVKATEIQIALCTVGNLTISTVLLILVLL